LVGMKGEREKRRRGDGGKKQPTWKRKKSVSRGEINKVGNEMNSGNGSFADLKGDKRKTSNIKQREHHKPCKGGGGELLGEGLWKEGLSQNEAKERAG